MKRIVIGTAGHIDHGKTTLIKALTGIDCDRLKEEKERGITLDLGFAHYRFGDGTTVGIVDVPGHERLVRHMVAGAWGIDLVLFVVAADEGIMPQTKEHLDICELLGLKNAIFAITKIDLVDKEMLELVKEELKDYLRGRAFENAPFIPCSAATGEGIERLKEVIREEALKTKEKEVSGIFRLPVDRCFTLKGIGTVVTGTCVSGYIKMGEEVEIYPLRKRAKIRTIQVYHESVDEAKAGERVALNLQGIEREQITRGVVVARPGSLIESLRIDATFRFLKHPIKSIKSGTIMRFHTATSERNTKLILLEGNSVEPGQEVFVQLVFKEPIVLLPDDPYILRGSFLIKTVGGGKVLDIEAQKHKGVKTQIEKIRDILIKGSPLDKAEYHILKWGFEGIRREKLQILMGMNNEKIDSLIKKLEEKGSVRTFMPFLIHNKVFSMYKELMKSNLEEFFKKNPQKLGMSKEELRSKLPSTLSSLFQAALGEITGDGVFEVEKDRIKIRKGEREDSNIGRLEKKVEEILLKSGLTPPLLKELSDLLVLQEGYLRDILERLIYAGKVVKVRSDMFYHKTVFDTFKQKVVSSFAVRKEMTIQDFKNVFQLSRKYLIPLLECLDSMKITIRAGEKRILRNT